MSNFKVAKNKNNAIEFTIKAKGSVDPIVIDPADTFVFKLVDLDMNTIATASNVDADTSIAITDAANGLITINLTQAQTSGLKVKLREQLDGGNPTPGYSAILDMQTVALGSVRAFIPLVEVVPDGLTA